ncbi:hypothetical protein [Burkholderia cenocepacia]|uniref:hypothetical protein n=1 Tax=Burkholderia cenocepacia TaxID=95486 RepID=UPI0012EC8BF5|nr:hypothetical protein [Burkholderia cenocepacia]MBR7941404.1 hypothetical protein [Burkholderia cenocepacia]MBR8480817.1 hypothetical protein [Burkholderia cenocepacia]MCW3673761.1 hypothetical protein [Burkholderia cenocepacia]MDC6085273.1 hypothetical protein [Burkholderia cenocepacia]MDN7455188.1 hypothetical protein [Burkholderia cenocepacia]
MELGAYRPSRYRYFLGWGAGLVVVGVGLLPVLIVFLAIGAFDQWHIQSEGQVMFYFSLPILMAFVGLILIGVGLVKRFKERS